jgi:hypothetical protein
VSLAAITRFVLAKETLQMASIARELNSAQVILVDHEQELVARAII